MWISEVLHNLCEVPTGTNNGSNMKVYSSRKSALKKGLEPQSSLDVTSIVQQRGRMKAARLMKQPSLILEGAKSQTQHQFDRTSEHTLNINEVINQELLPMVPLGSESMYNGKGIDINSSPINSSLLVEGLTATINSPCQANRNATVLTDSAATQVAKINCLMEAPTLSLDRQVQQDVGKWMRDQSFYIHRMLGAHSAPLETLY
uniref:Uncharacterized protein n=1 Tax=Arundo donax TaxID=35708 RepID=A0A0A9B6F3_ARUDO